MQRNDATTATIDSIEPFQPTFHKQTKRPKLQEDDPEKLQHFRIKKLPNNTLAELQHLVESFPDDHLSRNLTVR